MNKMVDEVIIAIAFDEQHPERQDFNIIKALEFYEKMKNDYTINLFGPEDPRLAEKGSDYKGQPFAEDILQSIAVNTKVIYIDDHSNFIAGGFTFRNGEIPYNLYYSQIISRLEAVNNTNTTFVVRGNESGKALYLCSTERKVLSSMRPDQSMNENLDWYNLSIWLDSGTTLTQAHDKEYNRLWVQLHRQWPVKCGFKY